MAGAIETASKPLPSFVRKVIATIGGIVVVMVLVYELLLGYVVVFDVPDPVPGAQWHVFWGLLFGLAGPLGVVTTWLVGLRSGRSRFATIKRVEVVGLAIGIPAACVLFVAVVFTSSF